MRCLQAVWPDDSSDCGLPRHLDIREPRAESNCCRWPKQWLPGVAGPKCLRLLERLSDDITALSAHGDCGVPRGSWRAATIDVSDSRAARVRGTRLSLIRDEGGIAASRLLRKLSMMGLICC